jgi:hypothetical protein
VTELAQSSAPLAEAAEWTDACMDNLDLASDDGLDVDPGDRSVQLRLVMMALCLVEPVSAYLLVCAMPCREVIDITIAELYSYYDLLYLDRDAKAGAARQEIMHEPMFICSNVSVLQWLHRNTKDSMRDGAFNKFCRIEHDVYIPDSHAPKSFHEVKQVCLHKLLILPFA